MAQILSKNFYERDPAKLAQDILGHVLVHQLPNGQRLAGRIVETEAYLGAEDSSAHTFGGRRTQRVQSMYLGGGYAYIYFIYGCHFCINVVAGKKDSGQAVLLRALEPLEGIELMQKNRKQKILNQRMLTNGPGKLCQAMALNRRYDGASLFTDGPLFIERGKKQNLKIVESTRVGLNPKLESSKWPLRFYLASNPYVSNFTNKSSSTLDS